MKGLTLALTFIVSFIATRNARISSLCLSIYSWLPIKPLDVFPFYFLTHRDWLIIFRLYLVSRFFNFHLSHHKENGPNQLSNRPPKSARLLKRRLDAIRPIIKSGYRTLDDLPQDVALLIAVCIQGWGEVAGVAAKREVNRL